MAEANGTEIPHEYRKEIAGKLAGGLRERRLVMHYTPTQAGAAMRGEWDTTQRGALSYIVDVFENPRALRSRLNSRRSMNFEPRFNSYLDLLVYEGEERESILGLVRLLNPYFDSSRRTLSIDYSELAEGVKGLAPARARIVESMVSAERKPQETG